MRDLTYGPMAILPEALEEIRAAVQALDGGAEIEAAARPRASSAGGVAVIPVSGPLTQRPSLMSMLFGGSTYQGIERSVRQAVADPNVKAIVLAVDSPGGDVIGAPETAAAIREARASKHVVASVTGIAASAAYWLASQADEIVVTPSGRVGSIGVIATHIDQSGALEAQGLKATVVTAGKYKGEASALQPLSEEGRAALQAMADDYHVQFVGDVAAGRKVSRAEVRAGFGEGRMVLAESAVKLGMANRIGTLDDVLARLGAAAPRGPAAEAATPDMRSGEPLEIEVYRTDALSRRSVIEPDTAPDKDQAALAAEQEAAAWRLWFELESLR